MRDGCGRGFSVKLFILGLQRAARYVRHATVGACHRTSNRQEHKIIQRARPEQDTIFHLHVTACRRRGSHGHDERLASCSSSFVSKVLGANYKTANNFLPKAQKFTMCTDKEATFEPSGNAHARVNLQVIINLYRRKSWERI